jgi:hypothetical protein
MTCEKVEDAEEGMGGTTESECCCECSRTQAIGVAFLVGNVSFKVMGGLTEGSKYHR